MAYETLPYHLLVTARELRELGINDCYFALHVTIDNPDSGHAALALEAVERFLMGVKERDGQAAMEHLWRRVQAGVVLADGLQAGVVLADGLPTTPCTPKDVSSTQSKSLASKPALPHSSLASPPSEVQHRMVQLLARKAAAAEKMHCPSRILINGHTIEHWLDPATFSAGKGLVFLRALGEKKPWVVQGNSERSRLVRELEWGGRMFGAFSRQETALVKRWIRSLGGQPENSPVAQHSAYRSFVGEKGKTAIAREGFHRLSRLARNNLLKPGTPEDLAAALARFPLSHPVSPYLEGLTTQGVPECSSTLSDPRHLASLWFTSISLLEHFALSPSKFATPLGAAVLRILRAQLGFPSLHNAEDICAGMDPVHDISNDIEEDGLGLWELGALICRRKCYEVAPDFAELARAIDHDSATATFCVDMLELRTRPYGQQALLLGLTHGFASYMYPAKSLAVHLTSAERNTLQRICEGVLAGNSRRHGGLPLVFAYLVDGFRQGSSKG